ncbi:hypothetical protein K469DRAFT_610969 [Zopfia rhizophila CBS 207.26]|uniref:Glycosyl transferase CAP10 domain-containing protein n=1 Tax=Zopfia rhizophila CBS 207.26 TaxID=1314779 RepID=A0A6A6D7B7_9PEZI|nr:hypothetical protein K469DRAFT_610969 [Zopfia rhizophila CBS 207.26]
MIYPSHSFQHLVICIFTFIVLLQLWSLWSRSAHPYFSYTPNSWTFNPDIHANTHTLSNDQCDIAFPKLYTSLENSVKRRKGRKVDIEEISIKEGRCMLRLMIYGGELFVVDDGMPESCYVTNGNERERILGTLAQIDRAITTSTPSDPPIPNIEFSISLDDLPRRSKANGTFFAFTRKDTPLYDDTWLMPNYAYWSWNYTHAPSWNSIRRDIQEGEKRVSWKEKDPRVVWRGKIKMARLREQLVKVSSGKGWSDIKPVVINNSTDEHTKDVMNLREFCRYKFTAQTEGTSYSGRLKYLQLCRSALITHPLRWQEFHTHLLRVSGPEINFIEANDDFNNLDAVMEYYQKHDNEAEEVAQNSYNTFARRYLTPAAVTCYWRRLFLMWWQVQGFEVRLYEREGGSGGRGMGRMRGTPWTAFAANWPIDPSKIP